MYADAAVVHTADSVAVSNGTIASGDVTSTQQRDGVYLQVEETGKFEIAFTFSGLTGNAARCTVRGRYTGNPAHNVFIEEYNSENFTEVVTSSLWNPGRAISLPSDNVHIEGMSVTLRGSDAGMTDVSWYLSWDTNGLGPVTDRVDWALATDMGQARDDSSYLAVGKIDLTVARPDGIGVANTMYLHASGAAGGATGSWTLYGTE